MANYSAKDAKVYTGGYDLSGQSSNVTLGYELATDETTPFGATDQEFVTGLGNYTIGTTSFWRDDSGSGTAIIYDAAIAASDVWSFYPAGITANHRGWASQAALMTTYNITAPVKGAIIAEVSCQGAGTLDRVRAMGACTSTLTDGAASTASLYDYGSACTSHTLVAVAHVMAISGTDPSVVFTIMESETGGSAADLLVMDAITASGVQRKTLSSSAGRYAGLKWATNASTTGCTFMVGFHRPE